MVLRNQPINSIMLITRTVMAESGLGGCFWFKAAAAGKDARNVTFKERVRMTPYQAMYGEKKDVQISEHSVAGLGYIQTSSTERRESTRREPKRQYTSGLPTS